MFPFNDYAFRSPPIEIARRPFSSWQLSSMVFYNHQQNDGRNKRNSLSLFLLFCYPVIHPIIRNNDGNRVWRIYRSFQELFQFWYFTLSFVTGRFIIKRVASYWSRCYQSNRKDREETMKWNVSVDEKGPFCRIVVVESRKKRLMVLEREIEGRSFVHKYCSFTSYGAD